MPKASPASQGTPQRAEAADVDWLVQELRKGAQAAGRRLFFGPQVRRWLGEYARSGFEDAEAAAKRAGYQRPGSGRGLLRKMGDLLEPLKEGLRMRRAAEGQMGVEEALKVVGELVRTSRDDRVRLSGARTILEAQGALGPRALPDAETRAKVDKQLHRLIQQVKGRLGSGDKESSE